MSQSLKLFFTLSVLINLLLAGIIAGYAGHFIIEPPERRSLQDIAAFLPADKQKLLKPVLQSADQDTGDLRQQIDDARKKTLELLKKEPFDKDAYLAQVQRINKLRGQAMQRMAEAVADIAAQSTPAERAVLADKLRRPARPADGSSASSSHQD